jgi:hypothetical protein
MKLFIWADPYRVFLGSVGLFVVANTVEEAKQLAKTGTTWTDIEIEDSDVRSAGHGNEIIDRSTIELGEPTRVVDLPCAEWHRWQE